MARHGGRRGGGGGGRGGRGRFGGRGRGRGGRGRGGGRGNGGGQPQKMTPNRLLMLNNSLCRYMLFYLTPDERKVLGEAYPRFKVQEPPQNQNNQQQQQQQQNQQNNSNGNSGEGEKPKVDPPSEETETKATENAENPAEESKNEEKPEPEATENAEKPPEESKNDEKPEIKASENAETPSEESKNEEKTSEDGPKDVEVCKAAKNQQLAGRTVADPNTLLARLNSKRLYKRIRILQKEKRDYKDAYPFNMTTEEIANREWENIMEGFNQEARMKRQLALAEGKESKEEDKPENERPKLPSPIPSSCELLLFSPCPRAVAVLASYPRSGNSLLRNLYERTTLRVTGSDMWGGLTKHDLVGEAATQTNCVQFVKTHFPERRGNPPFRVDRAVLLVRNPYDAMESYFNLMMTNTHTTSLSEEERQKNAEVFYEMAKKEILVWRDFHEYWLQQKIPLLVIKYEDLIRYTDKVIAKVLSFVLEIKNMNFFESRIDRCIREEQIERLGSYRPRSGGIGKSLSKYTPELLQEINTGIISTMTKLGYKEMLVPNPSEWKLEPLDQYGVFIPGSAKEPLVINTNFLVRGPKRNTNWMAVRKQVNADKNDGEECTCYKCLRAK